jgi:hypothetical protein
MSLTRNPSKHLALMRTKSSVNECDRRTTFASGWAALKSSSARKLLRGGASPLAFRREPPARPSTAYELEWRAQGRSAHYFSYARRVDPNAAG